VPVSRSPFTFEATTAGDPMKSCDRSGLSSRGPRLKSIHKLLLIVSFTGDNGCLDEGNQQPLDASPSPERMEFITADHHGRPLPERKKSLVVIACWLMERSPTANRIAAG